MLNQLMDKEMQYLVDNFRLMNQVEDEVSIPLVQLLDEAFLITYLNDLKKNFKTDNLFVIASQFMKRLGFIMTVPSLYAMTMYNRKLDVRLSNSYLVSKDVNDKWMPYLYVKNKSLTKLELSDRLHHREEIVYELFNNLSMIIQKISAVASVPKPILWENVAIYVYWLYETRMKNNITGDLDTQVRRDFHYLLYEVPGSVCKESINPLQKF